MIPRLTRVKKLINVLSLLQIMPKFDNSSKETWSRTDCVHLSILRQTQKHAIRLVGVLICGIQMQQLVGNDILQWGGRWGSGGACTQV